MSYSEWAARHPVAAAELEALLVAQQCAGADDGASEGASLQRVRLEIARRGGMAWRNNVGALKSKETHFCPRCNFKFEVRQQPIRWGLCNDSAKLNAVIKSSDVIGILPRLITPEMLGQTIGQFVAIETKRPGWSFVGNAHETAQMRWLSLISSKGGLASFSTGEVYLP